MGLIQGALQAAAPRLQPSEWVSAERVRLAFGSLERVLPYPYAPLLMQYQVPARLAREIHERTPGWGATIRARLAQSARDRAARAAHLASLPPLEYSITPFDPRSSR